MRSAVASRCIWLGQRCTAVCTLRGVVSVGLLPGLALVAGAVSGLFWPGAWLLKPALILLAVAGWIA